METEPVSRAVVLGCPVLRLVAGELGKVVTPRVDDMRLGRGARVVTEGDRELAGWGESGEGLGAWQWRRRRGQLREGPWWAGRRGGGRP